MDYNKENIVKVIKSLERETWHKQNCAKYNGNKREQIQFFGECTAYAIVLHILESESNFNKMVTSLNLEEEE